MACPTTVCPAAVRSSRMRLPLVSSLGVLESEMGRTKQPAVFCPVLRCSCATWSGFTSLMGSPRAPSSLRALQIDGAVLHADRVSGHGLAGDGHAHARAEVELPAVQRTAQDVALDPAVAEIAALVRALVADGEDLVAAPVEDHVL